jgi:hypothetical protein
MGSKTPTSTSTTTSQVPAEFQQFQNELGNAGINAVMGMSPADTQSPYGTLAPMNQAQLTGMGMTIGRGLSGSPLQDAAQGRAYSSLMDGPSSDPYATATNPYMGMTNDAAAYVNPYANQQNDSAFQSNDYQGYGPRFQEMLGTSNNAIADAFARGTGAQTTANFARAGAQGGSAQHEAEAANALQLGGLLSNNTNGLLQQQFNQSAGLNENALNRQTQATDNRLNRATGAMQNTLNNQYNSGENFLNRNLSAFGNQQGLASNSYNNSQNNISNLLSQVPALSGLDYRDAAAVSGAGNQQFAYAQSALDALNQQNSAYNNFGLNQWNQLANVFHGVLGNGGTTTTSSSNNGSNGFGQMAGGLLSLASLFK